MPLTLQISKRKGKADREGRSASALSHSNIGKLNEIAGCLTLFAKQEKRVKAGSGASPEQRLPLIY
jgi:hypothetical protein